MKQLYTATLLAASLVASGATAQKAPTLTATRPASGQVQQKNSTSEGREARMAAMGKHRLPFHPGGAAVRGGVANDECADAIPLAVNAACQPTTATLAGATESMSAINCTGNTASVANDVWFSFPGTGNGVVVKVSGMGVADGVDPILEVLDGACGSLTSLGCSDATLTGADEYITIPTVLGHIYYARVYAWPYTTPPNTFDFSICVYDAPAAPVNDGCVSTPDPLGVGSGITFTGTTVGATSTGDYVPGSALDGANPAVWHSFVTTQCANVTISYCGITPAFSNVFVIITPSCPGGDDYIMASNYNFTTCTDQNATLTFNYLPAGTYYIPVMMDLANANGPYTIAVSAVACPAGYCIPQPANGPTDGDYIANVTLGTINNNTLGVNAYEDYTGMSTNLAQNGNYTLSITGGSYSPDVYAAWIDFNQDEIFEPSEKLGEWTTTGSSEVISLPFTVPANAVLDSTRLRVRAVYGAANMNPCTDYGYGETEDYSVFITIPSGVAELNGSPISIFPNPTKGDITVVGTGLRGTVEFELTDMTGRQVFRQQRTVVAAQGVTLPLDGKLAQGTYMLRIITGQGTTSQRVMVK